ncbi:MAG: hypothetical protein H3C62_16215 [Gemmatimonadaceae bacterium]|nr:hypothetical protein [Gemmatimonadaceae bacterium]
MTSAQTGPSPFIVRLARTGVTIGVVDALWAVVLTLAYGRSVTALWQGVAAVPFGRAMLDAGARGTLVGLGVHFCVALWWSFVFLFAHTQSAALRRLVSTTGGMAVVASLYGPAIWCVMSLLVIPVMTHTPTVITVRWVIQLCGHALFVGLPIVWTGRRTHW